MGVQNNYGATKSQYDNNLFYNKRKFDIMWEGRGTVDNSPDVDLRLLIEGKYQGLYVPQNTFCHVRMHVLVYDHTNGTFIGDSRGQGTITRASGGNVTYGAIVVNTTGTVGGGNFTVVPTANTTVQSIEMVCSDSDSEQDMSIMVRMEGIIVYTLASGYSRVPTAATAARTTAE